MVYKSFNSAPVVLRLVSIYAGDKKWLPAAKNFVKILSRVLHKIWYSIFREYKPLFQIPAEQFQNSSCPFTAKKYLHKRNSHMAIRNFQCVTLFGYLRIPFGNNNQPTKLIK
jgi:hypothetical protein